MMCYFEFQSVGEELGVLRLFEHCSEGLFCLKKLSFSVFCYTLSWFPESLKVLKGFEFITVKVRPYLALNCPKSNYQRS